MLKVHNFVLSNSLILVGQEKTSLWCYVCYTLQSIIIVTSHDCHGTNMFTSLFRQTTKKSSILLAFLWKEATRDGWFPSQRASNVESISMWWQHHDYVNIMSNDGLLTPSTVHHQEQHWPRWKIIFPGSPWDPLIIRYTYNWLYKSYIKFQKIYKYRSRWDSP